MIQVSESSSNESLSDDSTKSDYDSSFGNNNKRQKGMKKTLFLESISENSKISDHSSIKNYKRSTRIKKY